MHWLAKQPPNQRMFRISSDLFPAYTHDDWTWWYFEQNQTNYLEKHLAEVGELARQNDIRLSFHPGPKTSV